MLVFSRAGRRLAVDQELRLPAGERPDIRPVLNATGTTLYYVTRAEQSSIAEIKAMSLATGDVEEVGKGVLPAPRASRPGLAFAAMEKGTAGVNVYLRDEAGGVEGVTENYGARGIYWSPDGEKLVLIGKRWGSAPGGGRGQWLSAEQSVDVVLFAGSKHRLERVRSERGESYLTATWPDSRTAAVLVALNDSSGPDQLFLELLRYDAESGSVALRKVGAVPASYGDAQMSEDAGTAFLHKAPDSRDAYCLVSLKTGSFSTLQFPEPVRARMDPGGQAVLGVGEATGTVFLATRGDAAGVWDIEATTVLPAESESQLPSGMKPE